MENKYAIGAAAELCGMTAETLRHYDRVGLVRPREKDKFTRYRYYTDEEIVALKTVGLLRRMDLSLPEIAALLQTDDLDEVIGALTAAERKAAENIASIREAMDGIGRARAVYQRLVCTQPVRPSAAVFEAAFGERVLLLSRDQTSPRVSNLWRYHDCFYRELSPQAREAFAFEDEAGIFFDGTGRQRLYAVCTRWQPSDDIRVLPAGRYLCCGYQPGDGERTLEMLKAAFSRRNLAFPDVYVSAVRIRGLLKWAYEWQVFAGA